MPDRPRSDRPGADLDQPRPPTTPRRPPELDDFPLTGPNALGSFTQRAWARVIDTVITALPLLFGLMVLSAATLSPTGEATAATDELAQNTPIWLVAITIVFAVAYEVLAIAWRGQTIGKWALGLRIARYSDGQRPNLGQAALRGLLPAAAAVVAFRLTNLVSVGAFVVLASSYFNPLRRGWHDTAGGTIVIRTR